MENIWKGQRVCGYRGQQGEVPETELPDGAALGRGSHIPRLLFEFGRERQTQRQQDILGPFGHSAGDSKLQVSGKWLRVPSHDSVQYLLLQRNSKHLQN